MSHNPNKNKSHLFDGMHAPVNKEKLWASIQAHPNFPRKEKKNRRFIFFFVALGFVIGAFLVHYGHAWENQNKTKEVLPAEQPILMGQPNPGTQTNQPLPLSSQRDEVSKETLGHTSLTPANTLEVQKKNGPNLSQTTNRTAPKYSKKPKAQKPRSIILDPLQPLIKEPVPLKYTPADDVVLERKLLAQKEKMSINYLDHFAALESNVADHGQSKDIVLRLAQHLPLIPNQVSTPAIEAVPLVHQKTPSNHATWKIAAAATVGFDDWSQTPNTFESFRTDGSLIQSEGRYEIESKGSYGVQVGLLTNIKKWVLGIHLDYTESHQRMIRFQNDAVYNLTERFDDVLFDKELSSREVATTNTYNYADFSIQVGRVFALGRLDLIPSLGFGRNLWFSAQGNFFTETSSSDLTMQAFSQRLDQDPSFVFAELQATYPLTNRLDLVGGIKAKSRRNLFDQGINYRQSFLPVSMHLGLNYTL